MAVFDVVMNDKIQDLQDLLRSDPRCAKSVGWHGMDSSASSSVKKQPRNGESVCCNTMLTWINQMPTGKRRYTSPAKWLRYIVFTSLWKSEQTWKLKMLLEERAFITLQKADLCKRWSLFAKDISCFNLCIICFRTSNVPFTGKLEPSELSFKAETGKRYVW